MIGGGYIIGGGKKNRKSGEEKESVDKKEEEGIGKSEIGDSESKKHTGGEDFTKLGGDGSWR